MTNEETKAYLQQSIKLGQAYSALRAIKAILEHRFDDTDLLLFGTLTNAQDDISFITQTTLDFIEEKK